jgi:uncharacterized protein YqjF (DUF2071 family)
MFLEREQTKNPGPSNRATIVYAGVRLWPGPLPASYAIRATPSGASRFAEPGTLEHFLIERYVFYASGNNRLVHGRVSHAPYSIQSTILHSFDQSLSTTWNLEHPHSTILAHFSKGVDVEVFPIKTVGQFTRSPSHTAQLNS